MNVYILGVETSCDETAAAVLGFGENSAPRVASNVVASQHEIHARYGGVVPELAARRHVEMIAPVLEAALEEASIAAREIDAVAVTRGPGLVVALLVGLSAAKGLAWSLGVPLIGVHHLDGHVHSLYLPTGDEDDAPPTFPHLGFVVSGGHTDFYRVEGHAEVTHLGGTLDDALGEAYD
ncbi:MAG: tRNA (adenosine(37)-N6)-threonylcarbamoyltransferase complex transferase subunit TsaD, partial [Nitrospinae bacterium]|nr:tRNA (adenosine(37)-N6)-threonylcarbamoyltransferase complex transferase subunit TsaD [Nitrospinota bacterium]